MLYDGAEYRGPIPSSNYSANVTDKIAVCLHTIVGSLASADGEFKANNMQLSAHYGVAGPNEPIFTDGHKVQWVDSQFVAYAQMNGNWPPISCISIETGGQATDPWSDAQLASMADIIRAEVAQRGTAQIPYIYVAHGQHGITTHCNMDGTPDPAWGNHTCPGLTRVNQVPQLIQLLSGPAPAPVPAPSITVEVDVQLTKTLINVQLDATGKGWDVADGRDVAHPRIPFANFMGSFINGSDPTTSGYIPVPTPSEDNRGGFTQVEVFGGPPNGKVGVWLLHAT